MLLETLIEKTQINTIHRGIKVAKNERKKNLRNFSVLFARLNRIAQKNQLEMLRIRLFF